MEPNLVRRMGGSRPRPRVCRILVTHHRPTGLLVGRSAMALGCSGSPRRAHCRADRLCHGLGVCQWSILRPDLLHSDLRSRGCSSRRSKQFSWGSRCRGSASHFRDLVVDCRIRRSFASSHLTMTCRGPLRPILNKSRLGAHLGSGPRSVQSHMS